MGSADQLVLMRDVYSNEYYKSGSGSPVHVLQGITFEALRGQTWSILGSSVFEIMLLTEIMAGSRAYQKGQCSLAGLGMIRRKRSVLPHTFYIGSTNMLFGNMKVLEYLMFATSRSEIDSLTRQQQILDRLIAMGLDFVALTPIELLTPEEKAAVTLFCATFSQSRLLIMNLPRLSYDSRLITTMASIAALLRGEERTLIMTTACFELAQAVSTGIMLLHRGEVRYLGDLYDLLADYDKVIYTVQCDDAEAMLPMLTSALPRFTCRIDDTKDYTIEVLDYDGNGDEIAFFNAFSNIGVAPQAVIRNAPNLRNAYREVLRQYDI